MRADYRNLRSEGAEGTYRLRLLEKRRAGLKAWLDALEGITEPDGLALSLYDAWIAHGVMPYQGGYLEQPEWWRELMQIVGALSEYHELGYDIRDAIEAKMR
jgi:hypothetical protein